MPDELASMLAGICPKCGSRSIYRSVKINDAGLSKGNHIQVHQGILTGKFVNLVHYGCGGCGYLESYLADEKSIEYMREYWEPLEKPKRDSQEEE